MLLPASRFNPLTIGFKIRWHRSVTAHYSPFKHKNVKLKKTLFTAGSTKIAGSSETIYAIEWTIEGKAHKRKNAAIVLKGFFN